MENPRPTFLTVLCILTFIASAWGIYGGFNNYFNADMTSGVTKEILEETQDKMQDSAEDEAATDMAGKILDSVSASLSPDKIKKNGIASGISSILTLLGAILMWGLNKKGYLVYVAGILVSIIAPIAIYGGFMGITASGVTAFFGILFCILYYLNLKHMS